MLCPLKVPGVLVALSILSPTLAFAQATSSLPPVEQRMADNVDANNPADLELLQQLVDINSGTMHLAGVLAIKDLLTPRLEKLGFRAKWVPMDTFTHRAGDLVAE